MAFVCDLITLISERLACWKSVSLSVVVSSSSARLRTVDRKCRETALVVPADLFSAAQLLRF